MHASIANVRPASNVIRQLTGDGWLLFATRFVRLFAYGSLSVVLVFYLVGVGLSEAQAGLLLSLTLIGDTAVSLFLTTQADRLGRRRMLIAGAALMTIAGVVFAASRTFWILLLAGIVGVISPSGQEVGPFLPIEQASLSQVVSDRTRTRVLAWYTLLGSIAAATGALIAGATTQVLQSVSKLSGYRTVVILYAALGIALAILFSRLSDAIEAKSAGEDPGPTSNGASSRSRRRSAGKTAETLASTLRADSASSGSARSTTQRAPKASASISSRVNMSGGKVNPGLST